MKCLNTGLIHSWDSRCLVGMVLAAALGGLSVLLAATVYTEYNLTGADPGVLYYQGRSLHGHGLERLPIEYC